MKKYLLIILFLIFIPKSYAAQNSTLVDTCNIFGLVLGENSLSDVEKVLGPAKQILIGDAAKAEYIKCYHFGGGNNSVYLKFGSNSEMAGPPDFKLTSISLSYKPFNFIKQSDITEISSFNINLGTKSKLKLGLSMIRIVAILGKPTKAEGDKYEYSKCIKKTLSKDDKNYEYWANKSECFPNGESPYFDVCFTVKIFFKNSKAVKIEINRIESIC